MSDNSSIEWTDATWNPVTGCTKISPGCKHCYAERFAERFRGVKNHPYEQGFDLKLWPERLQTPLTWKSPRLIFVNSMSDLFHQDVPVEFIKQVFETISRAHQHTFQLLTKRAERLASLADELIWPNNLWMGVSIENQSYASRADHLRKVPAAVRFLSVEPLLGSVTLNLEQIHWVIVGGESGPGARPVSPDWVRAILEQCQEANVPFFFKQWGGVRKARAGRVLDDRVWDELPHDKVPLWMKRPRTSLAAI